MQNFPIDLHGELDEFVQRFGSISSAEQEYVANLEQHPTPDTTSQEWLNARSYRITGSVCGCIIDQNPYQSAEQFAIKKLWPQPMDERGQMACAWGAKHELDAEQALSRVSKTEAIVGRAGPHGGSWASHRCVVASSRSWICLRPLL